MQKCYLQVEEGCTKSHLKSQIPSHWQKPEKKEKRKEDKPEIQVLQLLRF